MLGYYFCVWILLHTSVYAIEIREGVNPESGTIVTPFKNILTGQSTVDVVFRIPNIEEPVWHEYPDPCSLTHHVLALLKRTRPHIAANRKLEPALHKLCTTYTHVKNTQDQISEAYGMEILKYRSIMDALRPRKRSKRSLGHSIRRFFGIADSDEQDILKYKVETLTKAMFTQQGTLINMTFAVEQQGARVQTLENAIKSYGAALNSTITTVKQLESSLTMHIVTTNTHLKLLRQVAALSNAQHHVMALHTNLLQQRATGMLALSKGQLSPQLLSPHQLGEMMTHLDEALDYHYPNMKHLRINLYEFYTTAHAVGYRDHHGIYVMLKVPLDFQDQQFQTYQLDSFPISVPDMEHATMVVVDKPYIAVSHMHDAYFLLDAAYITTFCSGQETLRCSHLQLQRHITAFPVCETAILVGDPVDIEKYCNIVLFTLNQVTPEVFVINSTHLYVSNPTRLQFYLDCPNGRHLKPVSTLAQFTIQIPCFCQLTSTNVATPTLFHDHCITFTDTDLVVTQHTNDILTALQLQYDLSLHENSTLFVPEFATLKYPELVRTVNGKTGIDVKRWLDMSYDDYKLSLFGRITSTQDLLGSSRVAWFLPSFGISTILMFIIFVLLLVLWLRYNRLAGLLTVMGLVRSANAAPLYVSSTVLISFEIVLLVFCILLCIACCVRFSDSIRRIYRNTSVTCCESLSLYQPAKSTALLYLASAQTYVYLHLGQLIVLPHEISLENGDEPLSITLHRSCANGFVTLSNHNLKMHAGDSLFALPKAIAVPWHLQGTVDKILRQPSIQVRLMVGCEGVYQAFEIKHLIVQDPADEE